MVTLEPPLTLGTPPMRRAALASGLVCARVARLLAEMRASSSQEAGLTIRLAMVLACIRQFDLAELGYSGFHAFCEERVDWRPSWVRALVRLVESPLDRVKAAAATGQLPLRIAVLAPGKVSVKEQAAWLGGAMLGGSTPSPPRRTFHGRHVEIITRARALAEVCMGRRAPLSQVDDYILRHWREHVPGKALEEGRAPPPAPEPRVFDFEWAHSASESSDPPVERAPAEALLGPWRPPADLADALTQLEAVQAVCRGREARLARQFTLIHRDSLWRAAGFDSPWDLAARVLRWSRRTAQRRLKLGRALERLPRLDEAVRGGLSPAAACDIDGLAATPAQCDRWLVLARHLGRQELNRALANRGERLDDYETALAIARRNAAALLGPQGPTSRPSGTVAVFVIDGATEESGGAPCAGPPESAAVAGGADPAPRAGASIGDETAESSGRASRAGTPDIVLRVALPRTEPERPLTVSAHPHLAEAARWFLAHNQPRKPSGFTASKHRARYRCENPECGRPTLRVAAHHIHWRRHGGADEPTNAVVLCPCCHLRGVHTSNERIRVTRVVVEGLEALLWEYRGRSPVLQFRETPRCRPVQAVRHGGDP